MGITAKRNGLIAMMNGKGKSMLVLVSLILLGACGKPVEKDDPQRVVAVEKDVAAIVKQVDGGAMTTATNAAAPTFAKVVAVDMRVDQNGVTLKNARVYYGEPPNQIGNPPMFTAQLLDTLGNAVYTAPLWDPRWTFVWSDHKKRDAVHIKQAADSVVILPFRPKVATLNISKGKERVATVEIGEALADFCAKNREDPECRGKLPGVQKR